MTLADKIIAALTDKPNQTSTQIAEVIGAEKTQTKVQLLKLVKSKKIVRTEGQSSSLRGPKRVFVYAVLGQS